MLIQMKCLNKNIQFPHPATNATAAKNAGADARTNVPATATVSAIHATAAGSVSRDIKEPKLKKCKRGERRKDDRGF